MQLPIFAVDAPLENLRQGFVPAAQKTLRGDAIVGVSEEVLDLAQRGQTLF